MQTDYSNRKHVQIERDLCSPERQEDLSEKTIWLRLVKRWSNPLALVAIFFLIVLTADIARNALGFLAIVSTILLSAGAIYLAGVMRNTPE